MSVAKVFFLLFITFFHLYADASMTEQKDQTLHEEVETYYAIQVKTQPLNADVEFIDSPYAFQNKMRYPAGKYRVKVSKPGYETKIGTIDLHCNLTLTVKLNAKRERLKGVEK